MSDVVVLRPRWGAFVLWPVLRITLLVTVVVVPLVLALSGRGEVTPDQMPTWLPLSMYLLPVVHAIWAQFACRRTRYELHEDHLLHHKQRVLFRATTQLPFKHITQVTLELPGIQYQIFRGGTLVVHEAGRSAQSLSLRCIAEPERIFAKLQSRLIAQGHGAHRRELIQEEGPPWGGVLLEVAEALTGWILILLAAVALPVIFYLEGDYASVDEALGLFSQEVFWSVGIALGIFLAAMMVSTLVILVDKKTRTMRLWDDAVELEQGWIHRRRQIAAVTKISDIHRKGSVFQRYLGLRDLQVSPKGLTGTIVLRSMANFRPFQERLETILSGADGEPDEPLTEQAAPAPADDTSVSDGAKTPRWREEFRVVPLRQILASLMATLPVLTVLGAVSLLMILAISETSLSSLIVSIGGPLLAALSALLVVAAPGLHALYTCRALTYSLEPEKVCATWNFLSEKSVEFSVDKLTAIRVRRDLFDRLLGTVSVTFDSIGEFQPIRLRHLPDTPAVEELIRRYTGGMLGEPEEIYRPMVSVAGLLIGRLLQLFWLSLLAIAGAVIAVAMGAILPLILGVSAFLFFTVAALAVDWLAQRRSRLELHHDHLRAHRGWLVRDEIWVPYHQARVVRVVHYPLIDRGRLIVQAGHGGCSMDHLSNLEQLQDSLDGRLYQWPLKDRRETDEIDTDEIATWQPERANALLVAFLVTVFSCVGLPLLALAPLYLLWNRAYYARASSTLEADRLIVRRGLIWPSRSTMLLNRIDQVVVARTPVEYLFNNGHVVAYAVGGGSLSMGPNRGYEQIDRILSSRLR